MPAITQNKLTPIFAICALLIVGYVLFARYGGGQPTAVRAAGPLPAVPLAPGDEPPVQESGLFGERILSAPPRRADADSPSETLKTVTASNNDLRDKVQKVIEANDLLKQENAKLQNNQASIVAQVTERVMAEQRLQASSGADRREADQAGKTKANAELPTALGGIVDAASGGYTTMVKSLGSANPNGIPSGLGYDSSNTADGGIAAAGRTVTTYTRHVYAGLDALSDPVIAGAVGNSMLADLVSIGGKIYKHGIDPDRADGKILLPHIRGHFDEVEAILGDEFIPMVNRMGGAGMCVTAYTQTVSDLQAKLKDAAKAKQLLGNFNHVITLRTKDIDSAKFIADQVPKVEVATLTLVSGVTDKAAEGDGIDFISNNQDRVATKEVPLIDAADIMQLPTGQAFALLEGNRLYKLRIPLADPADDTHIPASLKAVCEDMRSRYRTSEQWWKENDWLVHTEVTLPIATPIYVPTELDAQMAAPAPEGSQPVSDQPALASLRDFGPIEPADVAAPGADSAADEGALP